MIRPMVSQTRVSICLALAAVSACATTPAPAGKPEAPAAAPAATTADAEGFVTLFDGTTTDGWQQAGPGRMVVSEGFARTEGGMGLWYYKQPYKDFILRLQFRQSKLEANAGVFVRFPRVDGDPWIPVKEGYEIQIANAEPGDHNTGSVYSFKAADKVPLKPAGEWNDYEIKVVGQTYEISLNGELINTYQGERALQGMVGLQNHGGKDVVDFRNVRVKEL